jgi:hypothetical protein
LKWLIFTNAAFGFSLFGVVFWMPALFEREYGFTTEAAGGCHLPLRVRHLVGGRTPIAAGEGFGYLGKMGRGPACWP